MKVLYIIAVVSFAALAWAAFAITRHIRKNSSATEDQKRKRSADEVELSHAIDRRLSSLARPADNPQPELNHSTGEAGFAPAGRRATDARKHYAEPSLPAVKPATADHS